MKVTTKLTYKLTLKKPKRLNTKEKSSQIRTYQRVWDCKFHFSINQTTTSHLWRQLQWFVRCCYQTIVIFIHISHCCLHCCSFQLSRRMLINIIIHQNRTGCIQICIHLLAFNRKKIISLIYISGQSLEVVDKFICIKKIQIQKQTVENAWTV